MLGVRISVLGAMATIELRKKMISILRTCSQVLSQPELQVWNSLVERHLHLSEKYVSGLPKIKAIITEEIKCFCLDKIDENALILQIENADLQLLADKVQPCVKQPPQDTLSILPQPDIGLEMPEPGIPVFSPEWGSISRNLTH